VEALLLILKSSDFDRSIVTVSKNSDFSGSIATYLRSAISMAAIRN
jgi:hypothetical protein